MLNKNRTIRNLSAVTTDGDRPDNLGLLWASDDDVREYLTPAIARDGVIDAFLCHADGNFAQPLKLYLYPGGREQMATRGRQISMPAGGGPPINMVGMKWISSMPINLERGLPRASGILVLNDPVTGRPVALMECGVLSARRTAAVASLAVEHLAPAKSLRIAILGCSQIGSETVTAVAGLAGRVEQFRLFDLRRDRAEALAAETRARSGIDCKIAEDVRDCVRHVDVVIAATTGAKGYLKLEWLTPPWLMVPLSLDDCEPEVMLAADKLVCDDWDQSNREEKLLHRLTQAGKLDRTDLYAEFGRIVSGRLPGREGNENIYANFMGMALEDIGVGARLFRALVDDI